MRVEQIFKKDIHRPINSVVQAGQLDPETIKNELEEYVVTEEGSYFLETFYKNYLSVFKNPSTNVGVWVSGFFGSGKSHFLKIISYLLDNKTIDGRKPIDYFTEKMNNNNLLSMMQEVSQKESDAVLFNIDSRTSTSATDKERIVEVVMRVFNNHLGYSDTLWIAEMERQLDDEIGHLNEFKESIHKVTGKSWGQIRLKAVLNKRKIINALVEIGYDEDTATSFFDIQRHTFEMDSKRLSELIAEYCEKRGPEYRLNFLIDEVGQYIGANSTLMLNLQSVVEDIGNRCRGQAWVIVTSQENIESSVTNIDSTRGFSKIQGRFATRINLSSANTDEVIKRRLLDKTDSAINELKPMYEGEEQLIKGRLTFDHNTSQLRSGFRTVEEFIFLYPFIPYQVELLQNIFTKIRNQGEGGAHLAHGERSLLKAFQEAAQLNSKEEVSNLVTLAEFYPSIRDYLESSITSTIFRAEDNAKNNEGLQTEDIAVLKVLYLIKGIDEIKSTSNNIATLLVESIYDERQPLEYRVKESLNRLQQSTFIEQHADGTFAFLSDEEQEINRDIRVEDYDHMEIKRQLGDMFFGNMYKQPKFEFKAEEAKTLFDFNKRFDNYTKGHMSHSLTMQVFSGHISPVDAALQANSGQLIICLDEELLAEAEGALRYVEQVQNFVKRKKNPSTTQAQINIFDTKIEQVDEFSNKAENLLRKACDLARLFIQGQERDFKGNFDAKVDSALHMLVRNTYTKLEYIEVPIPFNKQKDEWKNLAEFGLSSNVYGGRKNQNALEEMKFHVEELARFHDKTTLKAMIEKYRAIPYGWSQHDVIGIVLVLLKEGQIKLMYAGDLFTTDTVQFYDRLSRVTEQEKIVVLPVVAMDNKVKRDVVTFIRDLFEQSVVLDTYDEFTEFIQNKIRTRFEQPLEKIQERRRKNTVYDFTYPGGDEINAITTGVQKLLSIRDKEQFVREIINVEDDLDEWLDSIERLKGFYFKSPIQRFDEAVEALHQYKQDLTIIHNDEIKEVQNKITNILVSGEPYRDIPNLSGLVTELKEKLQIEIEEQRKSILLLVEGIERSIADSKDFYSNEEMIVNYIENEVSQLKNYTKLIQSEKSLTTIRIHLQQLQYLANRAQQKAKQLEEEIRKKATEEKASSTKSNPFIIREKAVKRITPSSLHQIFFANVDKIETQNDLDRAMNHLKGTLLRELRNHVLTKDE